jgi:CheY-like chemotaxis protein
MSDPKPAKAPVVPDANRPFILIADDDADTVEILRVMAEEKGWCVDSAITAREIIDKVNYHCRELGRCYDCIVSDVHFFDNQPGPKFTGITAIGAIRRHWANVPVIFYSAYLNTMMRDEIGKLGNTQAIEKSGAPFSQSVGTGGDVMTVIARVEATLDWAKKFVAGDRRKDRDPQYRGPFRREDDCKGEIRVEPALEEALREAKALRGVDTESGENSSHSGWPTNF